MTALHREIALFAAAAAWASEVVGAVPDLAWDEQGLGEWSMRSLVGHTSRALLTVEQYLSAVADEEELRSAEEYYERVGSLPGADPAVVLQRGVDAGIALGAAPADEFAAIAERVAARLHGVDDRLIATIAGGIMLSDYLPTRVFELVVHGLDIARAAGLHAEPPRDCLARTLELGTSLAQRSGRGSQLLMALTGRVELPAGFTVLP